MEEKKKKKVEIPTVIKDETSGEVRELKVVSAAFSKYKEERECQLLKTEADTYALCIHRKVEDGEDVHQELYMSKKGFALFVGTVLDFLNSENVDLEKLFGNIDDFRWNYIKEGDEIEEDEE